MEFSRRHFLGAGSAIAAAGLMSAAGQASAQTAEVPAKLDETVDFLIVGTGFAALRGKESHLTAYYRRSGQIPADPRTARSGQYMP